MEKAILLPLTYLIGIAEIGLGIFFWATHSKSEIRKVMALLSLSTGLWVVCSAFTSYTISTPTVIFINRLVFVFGIILLALLTHFSAIFPLNSFSIDRLHLFLFYIPVFIFSVLALFTNEIVKGYIGTIDVPGYVDSGPLHDYYNLYLVVLFLLTLFLLGKKTFGLHEGSNLNTKPVFLSILLAGIIPVIFDLLIPVFAKGYYARVNPLIGADATLIWLGMTTAIVIKS